ncbi:L-seryl-tRNA(Sec) kinase-like [Paramacrobiotus metropolitanus]|uniref:L-seryl-tRNA(Sec) kinase-like n=1 Tax=Paramacrobiotus metropolitanus TaxID=2943436 RepID=UPI0024458B5F|nr:L-seryl-tRNA(Sec) kinase-like [Paramacrobiotus metropolitanus]
MIAKVETASAVFRVLGQLAKMDIVLVLLCGPPAVGKSTLAKDILTKLSGQCGKTSVLPVHAYHIEYDRLIPVIQPLQWKSQRDSVARAIVDVCQFLKVSSSDNSSVSTCALSPLALKIMEETDTAVTHAVTHLSDTGRERLSVVFLLDDNFYYRSMRYDIYKLAADLQARFGEVFVSTASTETALARNVMRSTSVTESTITRMLREFEMPNSADKFFEKNFTSIISPWSVEDLTDIVQFIEGLWRDPPVRINRHERDCIERETTLAREVTKKSVLHQADCILRKRVSEKCNVINGAKGENNAKLIAFANSCRKSILKSLEKSELDYFALHMCELEDFLVQSFNKAHEQF